ncbi:MAG: hypothetical protein Q9209_004473 [Squamulea sp. 1 TL-2023]
MIHRTWGWLAFVSLVFTLLQSGFVVPAVAPAKDARASKPLTAGDTNLALLSPVHNEVEPRSPMLAKRTMFANLGLRSSQLIAAIQPIDPAAHAMKYFYDVMFWCATQSWPQYAPPRNYIIKYGAFELAMFAEGGPIPWQWMAEFARMMSQASSMGFTSTYHMLFSDPDGTHAISAALSINPGMTLASHVTDVMRGYTVAQLPVQGD